MVQQTHDANRSVRSHTSRSIRTPPSGRHVIEDIATADPVTSNNDAVAHDPVARELMELQRLSVLGILAGSLCHELNNTLTPILSFAKLGLRKDDPEFHQRAFERIVEAAQNASAITRGALGLARPDRGRPRATDLAQLVEDALRLTRKDLTRDRIAVEFHPDQRPHARLVPVQIQQVLLNILINARQAIAGRGGRVDIAVGLTDPSPSTAQRDNTKKIERNHSYAYVRIADDGPGIPTEVLAHIFEPFYTTNAGPDRDGQGGTGLGLALCRRIIEQHRGRLRVESRPRYGTAFTLFLPACPAPHDAATKTWFASA